MYSWCAFISLQMVDTALFWKGILVLFIASRVCDGDGSGTLFTNCGGVYEAPRGVIQTPNFPGPYPTPIQCEWLIHASPEKKIIIYFTQFYMTDSFYVTEYDYYPDKSRDISGHDLGRISWQHDLLSLAAYKPYVLIEFDVESIGNRHLRVIDSLLDVHGFNITYEIVDKSTDVTKHTCSVKECSYLGNCLVSSNFSKYQCECFEGFFGNQCQYGPYCDPDNGINQCSNGGRCEYFLGPLINQCDCLPGFYGPHCEIDSSAEGELDEECKALNCSQLCDHNQDGKAVCLCMDGYKMDIENGTCIPIARYRMDVTLKLTSFVNVPDTLNQRYMNMTKDAILEVMEQNGISTISKFGINGLRNTSTTSVLEFFFYCKVSEVDQVEKALRALVKKSQIGMFKLENTNATYEKSPELHLSEITNYDTNPTLQGKLLTLVCAAKGSKNIKFQWYWNDYEVNIQLTQRNAWETKIPHTVLGMQLSVLNIAHVSPFDAGIFTCEVSDFDDKQYGSVKVEVRHYPQVDLDPMSASIMQGTQVSIKCISPDDSWQQFAYEWFKNGEKIDPSSKEEYTEKMFPTGVRLVVPSVKSYAEYTCRVTNEAGSANVTAYIYAVSYNKTSLFCPKNYTGQVMWQPTAGGHFDIQRCPTEQGDFSHYSSVNAGYARRYCKCDETSTKCSWTQPNFAKCQSLRLVNIYDELELLRLGYQQTTLKRVFDLLYHFVLPNHPMILYSGDIDMVSGILKELLVHMKNFPELATVDEIIPCSKLIHLMSEIVTRSSLATDEEKELMLAGGNIIQMTNILLSDAGRSLNYTKNDAFTSDAIDMHTDRYLEVPAPPEVKVEVNEQIKTLRERSIKSEDIHGGLQDAVVVKLKKVVDLLYHKIKNKAEHNIKNARKYPAIISPVYSVAPFDGKNITYATPHVEITIQHDSEALIIVTHSNVLENIDAHLVCVFGCPFYALHDLVQYIVAMIFTQHMGHSNTTICLTWSVDPSDLYRGRWTTDKCKTVSSAPMYTTCHCKIPSHIVAAVRPLNISIPVKPPTYLQLDNILLVGHSISLTILFVTLFIYLRTCGQLEGKLYMSHLSFITCLFLSNIIVLICILNVTIKDDVVALVRMFLQFLYTTCFSFLLVEIIYVYLIVKEVQQMQLSTLKCLLLGWGTSVLLTIVVFITSRSLGFNKSYHKICWLTTDHWQIYTFIVPIAILSVCFIILMGISLWTLRNWKEEWRYVERKRHLQSIIKASIILTFLFISCLLALDLDSIEQRGQTIAYVTFHILLVSSVFLSRCVFDKQVRYLLRRMCLGNIVRDATLKTVQSSGSFRAFMKPEKVSNVVASQEEYNVSKYYDEVNRTKYTKERKKELSILLGSSGSSDITGDTKSTSISGGSNESDIVPLRVTAKQKNAAGDDSGVFDQSEGAAFADTELAITNTEDNLVKDDIHRSIFTHPLKSNPVKVDSFIRDDEPERVTVTVVPERVSALIKEPAILYIDSTSTKTASSPSLLSSSHNVKTSLQSKHSSPRTRLKEQLNRVEEVPTPTKKRNGYIRNPDNKLNIVVAKGDTELDPIDEYSILIPDSTNNVCPQSDASSCSSKLLSSSEGSNNDSPMTRD